MPEVKQPKRLGKLCIDNVVVNMNSHWFKRNDLRLQLIANPPMYILGPFECLSDENVEYILKRLHDNRQLVRFHLYLLLHNLLKRLDLSVIKKRTLINADIAKHIGSTCIKLTELNLFAQTELAPKLLCEMIAPMKNLKILNLSHTKANNQVLQVIAKNCKKLESLNLESCRTVYDMDLECLTLALNATLAYLNIDNVNMYADTIHFILKTCKSLRVFVGGHLINSIQSIYNQNLADADSMAQLSLDTIFIEGDTILKPSHMESIAITCPMLKRLSINCVGSNECLSYLKNFNCLSEITLANYHALFTFNFKDHFLDVLKTPIGKQLKSLHLIHIVDVNLKSIAKYCRNLSQLTVDFIGYYEPALDKDLTGNEELCVKELRHLSISNSNNKADQVNLNVGTFKSDLKALLSHGMLKSLCLNSLKELDDEYFLQLLSCRSICSPTRYLFDHIEHLEMKKMNGISATLVHNYFLKWNNKLSKLNLFDCKQITKYDFQQMVHDAKYSRFECQINWT